MAIKWDEIYGESNAHGIREMLKILDGKAEEKRTLGRSRYSNIKMDFKEIACGWGLYHCGSEKGPGVGPYKPSGSVKDGIFV